MLRHVDALNKCRYPHSVIHSIQDVLEAAHRERDGSPGESSGEIDRNTCVSIEEVIENAPKIQKVLAKLIPSTDVMDTRGDGPGDSGGRRSSVSGLAPELDGYEPDLPGGSG